MGFRVLGFRVWGSGLGFGAYGLGPRSGSKAISMSEVILECKGPKARATLNPKP